MFYLSFNKISRKWDQCEGSVRSLICRCLSDTSARTGVQKPFSVTFWASLFTDHTLLPLLAGLCSSALANLALCKMSPSPLTTPQWLLPGMQPWHNSRQHPPNGTLSRQGLCPVPCPSFSPIWTTAIPSCPDFQSPLQPQSTLSLPCLQPCQLPLRYSSLTAWYSLIIFKALILVC